MSEGSTPSSSIENSSRGAGSTGVSATVGTKSATGGCQRSWSEMAQLALQGKSLSVQDAMAILSAEDDQVLAVLDAAFQVRRKHFGKSVQLYYLKNAKSGLCPEDCRYCAQAKGSEAEIDKYVMLNEEKLMEGAKNAFDSNARTYCIVASGRGPTNREVDHVCNVVQKVKKEYGLHICACLGLLKPEQAVKLKEAGVDRINHNLNTSERYHDEIVSTHTFQDRLNTLNTAKEVGLELCAGMIVGMGEKDDDIVDVAFKLSEMNVASIPINFLIPIEGAQMGRPVDLDPRYCLKVLAMFRLTNPATELRIAGGREVNLRSMQAMGLYAANSMFVSDYLTTPGQAAMADFEMINDLGFEITAGDYESKQLIEKFQNGISLAAGSCESQESAASVSACGATGSCGDDCSSGS